MAIPRPIKRPESPDQPSPSPSPSPSASASMPKRQDSTRIVKPIAPVKFVRSTGAATRRMIISLTGEEKSGKNHTAFTAPAPIYLHSFDIGIDGVIQKFHKKKEIYVASYELDVQPGAGAAAQQVADAADKVWQQFVSNYRDGLASAGNGTTIIDTDTESWELLRLARFGKLTQVMPHMYGPVNAEMRDLIREAYDHKANVFLLSKYVDEWENYVDSAGKERGRKTGNKVRKGFADLPFLVQVNARCRREDTDGGGSEFFVDILDCRMDPSANNCTIHNNYDDIALAVFGE